MKTNFKKLLPKKSTVIKSIITVFILSIISTYVTSALYSQQRVHPDNPLQEKVKDHSEVPLFGNYLDLVHADKKQDENKQEDKDEKGKDEEEKDEDEEGQDRDKEENEQKAHERKENHPNNSKDDSEKTNEGGASNSRNDESPHTEIIDPETDETDEEDETNKYFVTSIENDEIATESTFNFSIKQLEHDFNVQDIHVTMEKNQGVVNDISKDFSKPVTVQLELADGENDITIEVTYKDNEGKSFTVLREYTIIYDRDHIVIETDLQDEDVTDDELSFEALAKKGKKQIPLKVHLQQGNEQMKVTETDKNTYAITLQEGKNHITLSAKSGDSTSEKTVTINYVKPEASTLKIETNLGDYHDKEVNEKNLSFTAKGYDGEEAVSINVSHNDQSITGENNTYHATLEEGKNTLELQVRNNSDSHAESYVVYYEPEATGGEDEEQPDEKAPEITVFDITDGETISNSIRTFQIKVKNYEGLSITNTGNISVTNNGENVARDHTDDTQISFTLPINNGTNEIVISAEDGEGNKATKELTIHGKVSEDGDPIGTATVSVKATTVGLGYLIPEQQVEIYQGERATYVVDRLLKEYGYDYSNTGSLDSNFYMASIKKPGLAANINIPEDLEETLGDHNIPLDLDNYHPDALSELQLTPLSGWMYSVNGIYVNVGFADYYLKDGDVVNIQFSLAYGNDIGIGKDNFHKEW